MRVIAGDFRGRRLKSLPGDHTRPTTDKVKESMFNIIGPYFDGGRVLDLYAGSGALAIEAVSRGADEAVCVDKSYPAINVIQENIALTKQSEKFMILKMDSKQALAKFVAEAKQFDYVFLDPPYAKQEILKELDYLVTENLLAEDAVIVCENVKELELPEVFKSLRQTRRQQYGATAVTIYRNEVSDEKDCTFPR